MVLTFGAVPPRRSTSHRTSFFIDSIRGAIMAGEAILVFDSDFRQREKLATNLRHAGYAVTDTSDEAGLKSVISTHRFDFAIVNLPIPGLSGLRPALIVRKLAPKAKLIVTSNYHYSMETLGEFGLQATAFLPKPFRVEEVMAAIEIASCGMAEAKA